VVEAKFLEIIQQMSLSHLETAALRLAIARGDASIAKSLEVFRSNMDEEALVRNLRDIARSTVAATLEEKGLEIVEADEDEDEENDEEEEDEDEDEAGELYPESDATPASRTYEDDFEEDDFEEDDDEDEDEDDEEGFTEQKAASPAGGSAGAGEEGGMMADKAARDHVFPILVKELVKEEIMGADDAVTLLKMYMAGSPVIHGALDVYDLDSEMGELVDTLSKAVRSV
jgi:hypothetical protein